MFVYNGLEITNQNYKTVFNKFSLDVLDEIRLAIADGTQIGEYIDSCYDDYSRLGEIRKCLRVNVPKKYLCSYMDMTPYSLSLLRKLHISGTDLATLNQYFDGSTLLISPNGLEVLLEFVYINVDISKFNFLGIPTDLFREICKCLHSNLPIWVVEDELRNGDIDNEKLQVLAKVMRLGYDISSLAKWDTESISYIVAVCRKHSANCNDLLTLINTKFSPSIIELLASGLKYGDKIKRLAIKDENGYPIYNEYQIELLIDAMSRGIDEDEMFDPTLPSGELETLIELFA